jgi:opacity protein-like surface antigen
MKKVVLSVLMLVGIVSISQAQGLRLGVKAGTNLNKISGQSFNDGFDLSYHVGAFIEADFNKKWGIQPELIWSQTTSKPSNFKVLYNSVSSTSFDNTKDIKLRYNVGSILSLNAGPQYSILINKDKTLLQNGQSAFKDGDLAMVLGAQLNFAFLRVYGRYNIGLQNINDIDSKDKWTSQQIQLGLGFKF